MHDSLALAPHRGWHEPVRRGGFCSKRFGASLEQCRRALGHRSRNSRFP